MSKFSYWREVIYVLVFVLFTISLILLDEVVFIGTLIGGAAAQTTVVSFWIFTIPAVILAVRSDVIISSLLFAAILAAISAPGTQKYLEVVSLEVRDLNDIFFDKFSQYFLALLLVQCTLVTAYKVYRKVTRLP